MMSHTLYLALCGDDQNLVKDDLSSVLKSAGINIIPEEKSLDDKFITESLSKANCSVHILFQQYSPILNSGDSLSRFQFFDAKKQLELNPDFKIVVWLPPSTDMKIVEPKQLEFINEVRNNISKNMVFSNAGSSIQLADDIRSLMEKKETIQFDVNSTDIFLVSNQLDENEANEIIDMLSDIVPVEKLNIIQDSDVDYAELCKQQIPKSKLAVVYFKQSGDWAVPFAQQVWKKIGGATTHTPILLIGDDEPETNLNKKFIAPKVISLIIAGELIPLEIKVQYDKVAPT